MEVSPSRPLVSRIGWCIDARSRGRAGVERRKTTHNAQTDELRRCLACFMYRMVSYHGIIARGLCMQLAFEHGIFCLLVVVSAC